MKNIVLSDLLGDETLGQQTLADFQLSADSIAAVINDVIDNINEKMPLSGTEGSVVYFTDLSVGNSLSSSSFQIVDHTSDGKVFNFCSRGGVIEGGMGKYAVDSGTSVGACVGALGYCCLSVWYDAEAEKTIIKLSGDISNLEKIYTNTDAEWTLALISDNVSQIKILSTYIAEGETSAGYVVLDKQVISSITVANLPKTEEDYIAIWTNFDIDEDDNILYCPRYPDAGNQKAPLFYSAHIEGCKTKAFQRCTHAEGRRTIADGRYSHAEGSDNVAYGVNAHVEGAGNIASGYISHAEGNYNKAIGLASHAENARNIANGTGSHAEGTSNTADGNYSHVEGGNNNAVGEMSHAQGRYCKSNGAKSFAAGENCTAQGNISIACGNKAIAQGKMSFVWNGTANAYGSKIANDGIFAVNPTNGTNGFYIGEQTLSTIIDAAVAAALKEKGL